MKSYFPSLFKEIYKQIPFKKQLFSALKMVWKPSEKVFRHLHFKGIITLKINKTNSFKINHYGFQLENELFWGGLTTGWEKESLKLWIKLCERSETIVDIGANTGVYSLIAKAVNPTATVYAFEPVTRVSEKLKENISLNNFDIIPVEKAVSNSNGNAIIYDTPTEHTYSVTVNKNRLSADTLVHETKIETITLDSFVKQNNIKKIDLIKIDVETHEPEVLEGFSEYLSRFMPSMLIEILNEEEGEKIHLLVQDAGYLYFNINESGLVRKVEKVTKSDNFNFLLCKPEIAKAIGLI